MAIIQKAETITHPKTMVHWDWILGKQWAIIKRKQTSDGIMYSLWQKCIEGGEANCGKTESGWFYSN